MPEETYPGPHRPMLAAQLRLASEHCHAVVFDYLRARGFDDLRQSHFDLFRFPGPEGVTPTQLAQHVGVSKQALNPLLNELEIFGYLKRQPSREDGRSRVVRLTPRGLALVTAIREALEALESAAAEVLGPRRYAVFMKSLEELRRAFPAKVDMT